MAEDICRNCNVRPATLDWVGEGGVFAVTHGCSVRWCNRCALVAQIAYAKKIADSLDGLRAALAKDVATDAAK